MHYVKKCPFVSCNTHTFNGPLSRTTRVSRYQKGKPVWILLKQETVSVSGICWAICKSAPRSRQNHASIPPLSFLQAGCPSCRPTNSVRALKATQSTEGNCNCNIKIFPWLWRNSDCVIEALANPERERLKTDDTNISFWLQCKQWVLCLLLFKFSYAHSWCLATFVLVLSGLIFFARLFYMMNITFFEELFKCVIFNILTPLCTCPLTVQSTVCEAYNMPWCICYAYGTTVCH